MDNYDYIGEIEVAPKKIKSQIMVNIIEGTHYYKSNVNTYVIVEIPSYFFGRTVTRKNTPSPSYFKVIINYILNI